MLKTLFSVLMVVFITACGSTTYTTQESEKAFLQLQGNISNSVLVVDDQRVTLDDNIKKYELQGKQVADFPVSIGAHQVKVYKGSVVVFNRKVFIAQGQTYEVVVP